MGEEDIMEETERWDFAYTQFSVKYLGNKAEQVKVPNIAFNSSSNLDISNQGWDYCDQGLADQERSNLLNGWFGELIFKSAKFHTDF